MAQFVPNGRVRIMNGINWNKDYKDTRYFSSKEEQLSYFMKRNSLYDTIGNGYVRQELGYIAIDMAIETMWSANYLMFQNDDMGDKWFYAFVDRLEMKAASTTYVYYTIDIMQTWMFDVDPIQAFVERRHFGIESKGQLFKAPENMGTGWGYVTTKTVNVDLIEASSCVVLLTSSVDLQNSGGSLEDPKLVGASGCRVYGFPSGCDYYLCGGEYGSAVYDVFEAIADYPWISKGILGCTLIPSFVARSLTTHSVSIAGSGTRVSRVYGGYPDQATAWSDNIFSQFPDVPYNKILMYPFSLVEISNYSGQTIVLKPQLCGTSGRISIQRTGLFWQSPQIKYWVTGYGEELYYDLSVNVTDFPQCPVQDSSYITTIERLKQQGEITTTYTMWDTVSSVLGAIGTAASGNVMGSAAQLSGALEHGLRTADQLNLDLAFADTVAPTIRNQGGMTPFNLATGNQAVDIRFKMIDPLSRDLVYAKWKVFGYTCKQVENLNPNRMSRFDYVETRDCHIRGNIPNDALTMMQMIYDKGITFWHDDAIGNYDDNEGVST